MTNFSLTYKELTENVIGTPPSRSCLMEGA
jgi:hypothetical protein